MRRSLTWPANFLLVMGLVLPFIWVSLFPNYAIVDVGVFRDWSACLQAHGPGVYLNCELRPNYPTVGLFLTGGVFSLLEQAFQITNPDIADQYFRYFLALFESLNFGLLILLLRWSQFRYPIATALGFMIIPSTWAGAAVWGQIDHVSLFFLLIALVTTLRYWIALDRAEIGHIFSNSLYCVIIAISTALYILNKQIALFSFPFLLLLLIITACKLRIRRDRVGLTQFIFLVFIFCVSFRVLDSLLFLETDYLGSSFIGVWAQGSGHGNIISGDGANLWVLLERDLQSTSHFPLFKVGASEFKPYTIGIVAYALLLIFLFRSVFKAVQHQFKLSYLNHSSNAIVLFYLSCFFHGISWLAFNVILTGSHDRHPYIAYFFLLLAIAYYALNQHALGSQILYFSGFTATAYGLFILSTKSPLHPLLFPFERNEFIAVLQAIWLVMLLNSWLSLCRRWAVQSWRSTHFQS